jgi:hypothetical protein
MIFCDTPKVFAGDSLARPLALHGLARSWDQQVRPIQRVFAYLVLEHAEDLALQNQAVQLFEALHEQAAPAERELFADYLDYAERHQQVIASTTVIRFSVALPIPRNLLFCWNLARASSVEAGKLGIAMPNWSWSFSQELPHVSACRRTTRRLPAVGRLQQGQSG